MDPILVTEGVTKTYGAHRALSDLSISIPRNAIYGLLGPNGAGKTTLIRIINQITYPDAGRVFFDGEPLVPAHIAHIGYLPEERGLYKGMRVGEQAMYLARLKGLDKHTARERLDHWFERLEITPWWSKKVQELSKGMAQKVQFAVTVLHEPKLLIFDEPFSGFDPINANRIKEEILHLKERGTSIIFSTHRMESVEELCDHIALLDRSEKILEGRLSDIKRRHRDNTFHVRVAVRDEVEGFLSGLKQRFPVESLTRSEEDGTLEFRLKLDEGSSGEALSYLNGAAEVRHFEERLPTVNDIFIKTVNQKVHA